MAPIRRSVVLLLLVIIASISTGEDTHGDVNDEGSREIVVHTHITIKADKGEAIITHVDQEGPYDGEDIGYDEPERIHPFPDDHMGPAPNRLMHGLLRPFEVPGDGHNQPEHHIHGTHRDDHSLPRPLTDKKYKVDIKTPLVTIERPQAHSEPRMRSFPVSYHNGGRLHSLNTGHGSIPPLPEGYRLESDRPAHHRGDFPHPRKEQPHRGDVQTYPDREEDYRKPHQEQYPEPELRHVRPYKHVRSHSTSPHLPTKLPPKDNPRHPRPHTIHHQESYEERPRDLGHQQHPQPVSPYRPPKEDRPPQSSSHPGHPTVYHKKTPRPSHPPTYHDKEIPQSSHPSTYLVEQKIPQSSHAPAYHPQNSQPSYPQVYNQKTPHPSHTYLEQKIPKPSHPPTYPKQNSYPSHPPTYQKKTPHSSNTPTYQVEQNIPQSSHAPTYHQQSSYPSHPPTYKVEQEIPQPSHPQTYPQQNSYHQDNKEVGRQVYPAAESKPHPIQQPNVHQNEDYAFKQTGHHISGNHYPEKPQSTYQNTNANNPTYPANPVAHSPEYHASSESAPYQHTAPVPNQYGPPVGHLSNTNQSPHKMPDSVEHYQPQAEHYPHHDRQQPTGGQPVVVLQRPYRESKIQEMAMNAVNRYINGVIEDDSYSQVPPREPLGGYVARESPSAQHTEPLATPKQQQQPQVTSGQIESSRQSTHNGGQLEQALRRQMAKLQEEYTRAKTGLNNALLPKPTKEKTQETPTYYIKGSVSQKPYGSASDKKATGSVSDKSYLDAVGKTTPKPFERFAEIDAMLENYDDDILVSELLAEFNRQYQDE